MNNIHIGNSHWIPIENIACVYAATQSEPIKNFRNRHRKQGSYIDITIGSKCNTYILIRTENGFVLYGSPLTAPRIISSIKRKQKEEMVHYNQRLPIIEIAQKVYITMTPHFLFSSTESTQMKNIVQKCDSENMHLKLTANKGADMHLILFYEKDQLALSLLGFPKRALDKISNLDKMLKEEWEKDMESLRRLRENEES